MAKLRGLSVSEPTLFEAPERAHARRVRRQGALFIPRLVTEAASRTIPSEQHERAFQIAKVWAELESSGRLVRYKETSIDTQFLDQLFGKGLGYSVKTASPTGWQLEHKYKVPEVGTADAALGDFPKSPSPTAVIELKGASTDLDRDRVKGRTAVQQCWDYLNALPGCAWGIVSNFSLIRLYHRDRGTQQYEEFSLQELRARVRFDEFYYLFERGGLLASRIGQLPRTLELLNRTQERQKQVGDDLYRDYQLQRLRLIEHLKHNHGKPLDAAIRIAQKLLDRVIFVAFCEDRDLLPKDCLKRATEQVAPFSRVANPHWQNFLGLFRSIDCGGGREGEKPEIPAFNGGLFAKDAEVDELNLDDVPWARALAGFGRYDFSEEVNVEVLGHLFERSVTELEKLRVGGLFAMKAGIERANGKKAGAPNQRKARPARAEERRDDASASRMPKSAQRKRFGIYYTPPAFTGLLVERTVDVLVLERFAAIAEAHKVDPESPDPQPADRLGAYWRACLESLRQLTVCDPACGSGAFLIRAYDALDAHYKSVVHGLAGTGAAPDEIRSLEEAIPGLILSDNLFGVDLSHEAVEITQLALWIRSARRGKTLADLSKNIIQGNSLVSDPAVHPKALDWAAAFPRIFGSATHGKSARSGAGFSCVVGNPPWERIKVQEREFFSFTDPETASAVSAADRRKRIEALPRENPELHAAYVEAQGAAQRSLDYARNSGRYPLTGKGDVNTYMLFAELARALVAPDGLVGLLVPSGVATDDTTKDFFAALMDGQSLVSLYDFENRDKVFEDVDGRFKFSALVFGGRDRKTERADFVFFARSVEETAASNKKRHIPLTAADMKLFNPNTRTCPIFRTRRDADLTRGIYRRVPILIDENRRQGGNPWGIRFFTMFHQTNDAEHFEPRNVWEKKKYALQGNVFVRGKKRALPLYEAKMVQAFDHRAASVLVEAGNWVRQGQKEQTSQVEHANPEFAVLPRWWVSDAVVAAITEGRQREWLLAYKDVTSATNERTMIATFLPWVAVVNSAPLILVGEGIEPRRECCLLANMNAFVYDFVARQKVGSVHLNFFIVEQLPTLAPDVYGEKCPWSKRETLEHWISERVLKLTCTADDMLPLARACDFKGSRGDGVHIWKDPERLQLRAELDAAYFHLYGVEREDAEYMLSTFTNTGVVPEEERRQGELWARGSVGEMTLAAYDALAPLAAG